MKRYVIFGDSEFAERIYKYIKVENIHEIVCFTNESNFISRDMIDGVPVIPLNELSVMYDINSFEVLIAIGYSQMNTLREKIYNVCVTKGFHIGSWISSSAMIYNSKIADGNILLPGVIVGPSCQIGRGNIIASGTILSHDNQVGNFNFLSTNVIVGGHASIGSYCFLGIHSTIKNDIHICDSTFTGSSTNVIQSIDHVNGVYIGNPARYLRAISLDDLKM